MSGEPKTFAEVIAFYNSLPRGRRIVGYAATTAILVLAAALGFAVYFEAGFMVYLSLGFLLYLATFHSRYALAYNLTQRNVRKIDYWYLGAAALGLLLFASVYTTQRDVAVTKLFIAAHQSAEEPFREKVTKSFADLSRFLCGEAIARSSMKPCEGVNRLSEEIKPHLSVKEIQALVYRLSSEVTMPYARLIARDKLDTPGLFSRFSIVQIMLEDWAGHMGQAPAQLVSRRDEESEIVYGFGQFVIWPFLLAYALALRITKVTIDVFEWAK